MNLFLYFVFIIYRSSNQIKVYLLKALFLIRVFLCNVGLSHLFNMKPLNLRLFAKVIEKLKNEKIQCNKVYGPNLELIIKWIMSQMLIQLLLANFPK